MKKTLILMGFLLIILVGCNLKEENTTKYNPCEVWATSKISETYTFRTENKLFNRNGTELASLDRLVLSFESKEITYSQGSKIGQIKGYMYAVDENDYLEIRNLNTDSEGVIVSEYVARFTPVITPIMDIEEDVKFNNDYVWIQGKRVGIDFKSCETIK